jgi:glycosyltransferase involved in cell wall biosynthesis
LIYYTQNPKWVARVGMLRKVFDYVCSNRYKIKWYTPVLYDMNKKEKLIDLSYMDYLPFFIYPENVKINGEFTEHAVQFLCVAKYEPRKNLNMLLEVVSQLHQKHKNFKLTIIGSTGTEKRDSYYENLKVKIDSMGLNEVITLLKNIPHQVMKNYDKAHHVFLMPSIKEPASVSQLEAMANGLAIICSKDNGTAHYIKDQKNGFIIEATHNDTEQAMERYLLQPELINEHRKESLHLVDTEFSIDKSYKKLMEIINLTDPFNINLHK